MGWSPCLQGHHWGFVAIIASWRDLGKFVLVLGDAVQAIVFWRVDFDFTSLRFWRVNESWVGRFRFAKFISRQKKCRISWVLSILTKTNLTSRSRMSPSTRSRNVSLFDEPIWRVNPSSRPPWDLQADLRWEHPVSIRIDVCQRACTISSYFLLATFAPPNPTPLLLIPEFYDKRNQFLR